MPYTYYEHVSDIGVRAEGATLDEAFTSGIEAALGVMFDLATIEETTAVVVKATAPEADLLFVEAINEVLSVMGLDGLAFRGVRDVEVRETPGGGWSFTAVAFGEPLDYEKHGVETEVKGATYSGLSYTRGPGGGHVLTCILDV